MKFPEMRAELILNLQTLSNPAYQTAAWIEHRYPAGVEYDEFDYVVHFFYDDTELAENPDSLIGEILRNKEESESIKQLTKELDAMFTRYGVNLKDSEYLSKPEWADIVCKSRDACRVFGTV
ncbi:SCO4402 family protein [Caballeronia sp. LZ035]|uniref:SCO4402 family protein n=1 Tax=Caballeronia sp. LZ035 TaxID=3038568 RepID=UPI002858A8A6|nr:hypothetical protein [Caballeronia sp. LZ035]MDR5758467.1 hypothetical protein [Caballeronia sp. LZ035]